MNKALLLALSSLLMINAHAASLCAYKDYFHLSDDAHPELFIVSGYSESDLILQLIGPRSFIIRDSYQCSSGYAHITVAYDRNSWCVLNIKDGPLMNHPHVSASCNNMQYLGTDYDGIGSYSYSIHLN